MIVAMCIYRYRNRNKQITHYGIKDTKGNYRIVQADDLKAAIKAKKIRVPNLILTSNNRLIGTEQILEQKKEIDLRHRIEKLIDKAKIVGSVKELRTACGINCKLISISNTRHVIYIPNTVSRLNLDAENFTFTSNIQELRGSIEVVGGGKELHDIGYMFVNCIADKVDISGLNTCEITKAYEMFADCAASYINISNLNTSKVMDMTGMFRKCNAQVIGLSQINTTRVAYMNDMFNGSTWDILDLSNFDTEVVRSFKGMFANCKANKLNISSFNTKNATGMFAMFYHCNIPYIDLSNFNTHNVCDISLMFNGCTADTIDFTHFDSVSLRYHTDVFRSCNSKLLTTDAKLLTLYNKK